MWVWQTAFHRVESVQCSARHGSDSVLEIGAAETSEAILPLREPFPTSAQRRLDAPVDGCHARICVRNVAPELPQLLADEGAKVLARSKDLPKLERLDLTANALTGEGIERLAKRRPRRVARPSGCLSTSIHTTPRDSHPQVSMRPSRPGSMRSTSVTWKHTAPARPWATPSKLPG